MDDQVFQAMCYYTQSHLSDIADEFMVGWAEKPFPIGICFICIDLSVWRNICLLGSVNRKRACN